MSNARTSRAHGTAAPALFPSVLRGPTRRPQRQHHGTATIPLLRLRCPVRRAGTPLSRLRTPPAEVACALLVMMRRDSPRAA